MATKPEIERLAVVETKVDSLASDIKDVKADINEIKNLINGGSAVNDKRYASKWVQTAVSYVIILICGAVLAALIALVVIPSANSPTNSITPSTSQTK